MTWNAAFPTPSTLISQSVNQIQTNWSFLATTIGNDHFFTGGSNGRHKWVNLTDTGAPALVSNSVLFSNTVGTGSKPYWQNAAKTYQIPFMLSGTTGSLAAGTQTLVDFTGFPNTFYGFITASDGGGSLNCASAFVSYDGSNARVSQLSVRGAVSAIGEAGKTVTITFTGNRNYFWTLLVNFPG